MCVSQKEAPEAKNLGDGGGTGVKEPSLVWEPLPRLQQPKYLIQRYQGSYQGPCPPCSG